MSSLVAITEVHAQDPEYAVVTNLGSNECDLSGFVLNAGDEGQDFTFPPDTRLAPGASVKVFTNKASPGAGEFSYDSKRPIWNNAGDVGVLRDPGGGVASTHSFGKRHEPPRMVVEPDPLELGRVEVGQAGLAKAIVITNEGGSDLRLTGRPLVGLAGADHGDFEVSQQPAPSIPPGGQTTVMLRFRPTAQGTREAQVRLESDDPSQPTATVALRGEATAHGKLELTTAPALVGMAHEFGEVAADGETKTLTLTLRNAGEADLELLSMELLGPSGAFSLEDPGKTTLAPGDRVQATVTFDPSVSGRVTGLLQIHYDQGAGEQHEGVSLVGTGTGPDIDVSADGRDGVLAHDFGDFGPGQAKAIVALTLTNRGKAPLDLTGQPPVRVGGGDDAFVVETQPGVTHLDPGASTELRVAFEPAQPGEHHGYVEIVSNDEDQSVYRVDLRGLVRREIAGAARTLARAGPTLLACLPDGTVRGRSRATHWWKKISGLSGIVGVYGHMHTGGWAIDGDGALWSIGDLGVPKLDGGVVDAAVGRTHVLALMEDGTVWARGSSQYGQCGEGSTKAGEFTRVEGIDNVVQMVALERCSVVLRGDGTLWYWGLGPDERVETEPYQQRGVPKMSTISPCELQGLIPWRGTYYAAAGSVVWRFDYYRIGYNAVQYDGVPGAVIKGIGMTDATVVLTEDGAVWTGGANDLYCLGQGALSARVRISPLRGLPAMKAVKSLEEHHTIAMSQSGRIYEWGHVYAARWDQRGFVEKPKITL